MWQDLGCVFKARRCRSVSVGWLGIITPQKLARTLPTILVNCQIQPSAIILSNEKAFGRLSPWHLLESMFEATDERP